MGTAAASRPAGAVLTPPPLTLSCFLLLPRETSVGSPRQYSQPVSPYSQAARSRTLKRQAPAGRPLLCARFPLSALLRPFQPPPPSPAPARRDATHPRWASQPGITHERGTLALTQRSVGGVLGRRVQGQLEFKGVGVARPEACDSHLSHPSLALLGPAPGEPAHLWHPRCLLLAPPRRPLPPGTCIPLSQSKPSCLFPRDPGRAKDLLLPKRQRDAGGRAREAAARLRGALTLPLPSFPELLWCALWTLVSSCCPGLPELPAYGSSCPRLWRGLSADDPLAPGAELGHWMLLKLWRSCAGLAAASPSGATATAAASAAAVRGMLSSPLPDPRDLVFFGSRLLLQSCAN